MRIKAHCSVVMRAWERKGYMQCLSLLLLLLLCFLDNELQHTYQILISSEDKQEHMFEFQRVQQGSHNTGPSVLPSWASFKFWLQLFIMSHRKTTKCWSELGKETMCRRPSHQPTHSFFIYRIIQDFFQTKQTLKITHATKSFFFCHKTYLLSKEKFPLIPDHSLLSLSAISS